ncbi:MAG TPA: hypothetical protein VLF90_02465 [Patescibacteria group bacterium]|nr:hypothetical protein [Patescibacteria group bacterium]
MKQLIIIVMIIALLGASVAIFTWVIKRFIKEVQISKQRKR